MTSVWYINVLEEDSIFKTDSMQKWQNEIIEFPIRRVKAKRRSIVDETKTWYLQWKTIFSQRKYYLCERMHENSWAHCLQQPELREHIFLSSRNCKVVVGLKGSSSLPGLQPVIEINQRPFWLCFPPPCPAPLKFLCGSCLTKIFSLKDVLPVMRNCSLSISGVIQKEVPIQTKTLHPPYNY